MQDEIYFQTQEAAQAETVCSENANLIVAAAESENRLSKCRLQKKTGLR